MLNGCKEPYEGQLKAYIDTHPEIHWNYIQTEQGGVSNARNIALDVAKGGYIVFLDDDDKLSENFLEGMLNVASENITPICKMVAFDDATSAHIPYWSDKFYDIHKDEEIISKMHARTYLSTACLKLLSIDQIRNKRFDIRFKNGEDALFTFSISDKIQYLSFAEPSTIYFRRIRENSAITKKRTRSQKILNGLRLICAYNKIYFSSPFKYSFPFFVTRILATIRGALCE